MLTSVSFLVTLTGDNFFNIYVNAAKLCDFI